MFLLLMGCEYVPEEPSETLVIEAYLASGDPYPEVHLQRMAPLPVRSTLPIRKAQITLWDTTTQVSFLPSPTQAGIFYPDAPVSLSPGDVFHLQVKTDQFEASASDTMPPPIHSTTLCFEAPEHPIEAIFADSLGLTFQQGYLYPISVTLKWPSSNNDSLLWIHALLQTPRHFPAAVVGFFLRTEQVILEHKLPTEAEGLRTWQGAYGVPVEHPTDSLPAHTIRGFLIRSYSAYAQFAATRKAPERREPASNIQGGRGIVAGMAIDSFQVMLTPNTLGCIER